MHRAPPRDSMANSPELATLKVMHDVDYPCRDDVAYPADSEYLCFDHLLARASMNHLPLNYTTIFCVSPSSHSISNLLSPLTSRCPAKGACTTKRFCLTGKEEMQAARTFPAQLRAPWAWAVDGSFFRYLHVHPGLERLYFTNTHTLYSDHVDLRAETFYGQTGALGSLGFGEHNAHAISRSRALVDLCVAINTDTVFLLVDTVLQLPLLKKLSIGLTPFKPSGPCADSNMGRYSAWITSSRDAIEKYHGINNAARSLEVHLDTSVYRLTPHGGEVLFVEEEGYEFSPSAPCAGHLAENQESDLKVSESRRIFLLQS
ncbi:hypothetical protein C8R44DRAFT_881052 [Mycena epipterygia]|nr:hypothetical protein C8R44DRAFT_881052 [Mycena epipterygia]